MNCNGCVHRKVCGNAAADGKCSNYLAWQQTGKELADTAALAVNSFSFDSRGFADSMCRQHRTLQQSFMREVVLPFVTALGSSTSYDDRNVNSVMLARAILERTTAEERQLPFV